MKIAPGVIEGSFETFRSCGAGRDECVVYWSGSLDDPGLVDRSTIPVTPRGQRATTSTGPG